MGACTVGNSEKSAKLSQCYEISSADLWGLPTVECLGQGSVPNWLLKRRPPMSIHSPLTKPSQLQHFHPLIGPLSSTFLALSSEGQMMSRLGMQPTIDRKSLMSRLSRSKTSSLAWCYPLAQVCSVLFNSQWWAELAFEPWLMFSRSGYITTERQHCLGTGRTNVPSLPDVSKRLAGSKKHLKPLTSLATSVANSGIRWDNLTTWVTWVTWRKPIRIQRLQTKFLSEDL